MLREVQQMVRGLHAAGIEVILDVVYNHTAELSIGGPRSSFRGIDNAGYYRQHDDGSYVDVTGCGNAVDTSTDAAARLASQVSDDRRRAIADVVIDTAGSLEETLTQADALWERLTATR